jgi:hypothetical protein
MCNAHETSLVVVMDENIPDTMGIRMRKFPYAITVRTLTNLDSLISVPQKSHMAKFSVCRQKSETLVSPTSVRTEVQVTIADVNCVDTNICFTNRTPTSWHLKLRHVIFSIKIVTESLIRSRCAHATPTKNENG